jgi:hypothetical protein
MSVGRLFWVQRDGGIVELPVAKSRLVLGRGGDCDVRMTVPSVSSRHAAIHRNATGMTIEDLQSTNGTRVNGRRIDTLALKHGDQIELGSERLVFFTDAALPAGDFSRLAKMSEEMRKTPRAADGGVPSERSNPATARLASTSRPPMINSTLDLPAPFPKVAEQENGVVSSATRRSVSRGFVTLLSGRAEGKRFPLTKEVTTLGQEGMQVFQIVMREDGFYAVRGPNSTAPFVNGATVDNARGLRLSHNDTIELAGAAVRFEIEPA